VERPTSSPFHHTASQPIAEKLGFVSGYPFSDTTTPPNQSPLQGLAKRTVDFPKP
jgi:hypothetical protein